MATSSSLKTSRCSPDYLHDELSGGRDRERASSLTSPHRRNWIVKEPTESPADIRFIWEKNRHALETCVPMQTHALPDGRAHALSWLRDTIQETTEYSCSVLSSAGNQTSKVHITVMRHEALQQEKWSQELATWRAVAGEHDRLMQGWRKAWESCSKDTF